MSLFLDVLSTPERHTGDDTADVVAKCLTNWEIEDKVMSVIFDNTSNNNKMVDSLATHGWKMFHGCLDRVRCFALILNLVIGVSQLCRLKFKVELH